MSESGDEHPVLAVSHVEDLIVLDRRPAQIQTVHRTTTRGLQVR